MTRKTAMLVIALALIATVPAKAHAASKHDTDHCDGKLERDAGELLLGPSPGDEGICRIAKTDERRVLQACRLGQRCVVSGRTELCPDAGECVDISNVTKARSK